MLLELAESVRDYDRKSGESLIAVHNSLKKLNEKQNGGKNARADWRNNLLATNRNLV